MATKGLVGGVNTATTSVSTSSNTADVTLQTSVVDNTATPISASISGTKSYSASINSIESSPVEYTGLESDSMYIHVDNQNRTICGDVKWRNMIAVDESQEDAFHAYPANKARINFSDVSKTIQNIQSNMRTLEGSCKTSTENISKYVSDLARIQRDLEECQEYCSSLSAAIDAEITARELDRVTLRRTDSENFEKLTTEISNLTNLTTSRLEAQENLLNSTKDMITGETNRATKKEESISTQIQAVTRLVQDTQADLTGLSGKTSAIESRITDLENQDPSDIISDHTERLDDQGRRIGHLSQQLSTEVTSLNAAVSKVRDLTYHHESQMNDLAYEIQENSDDIRSLQQSSSDVSRMLSGVSETQTSEIELRKKQYAILASRIQGEAQTRRESDNFHEYEIARLELRISNLQQDLIKVVQNFASELNWKYEELSNTMQNITFDFVDAGTAPI